MYKRQVSLVPTASTSSLSADPSVRAVPSADMDVDTDADNVHMQPGTEQTDQMLLEVSNTLDEASAEDLEELLKLYKNFGSVSYKDTVSEVYSPPRVSALAGRMGLQRGFALDLTVVDPDDGKPWDFDCQAKRDKACLLYTSPSPRD